MRTCAILNALEVCSRQGTIQIHVYLYLTFLAGEEHNKVEDNLVIS